MSVYTMDQVLLMYDAASENEKRELLDLAIATRMAFGASQKEWKRFTQLLSTGQRKVSEPSPSVTKEQIEAVRRLLKHGR